MALCDGGVAGEGGEGERREEGRKEGRKGGRKERRKEGRTDNAFSSVSSHLGIRLR
jgi:hypothetical protein